METLAGTEVKKLRHRESKKNKAACTIHYGRVRLHLRAPDSKPRILSTNISK